MWYTTQLRYSIHWTVELYVYAIYYIVNSPNNNNNKKNCIQ